MSWTRKNPRTPLPALMAVALASGCTGQATGTTAAPPEPLVITPSTSSWFEAERLPLAPADFGCVGVIEHRGEQVVMTATEDGLLLLHPDDSGWTVEMIPVEPGLLTDRINCAAAELDDTPGIDVVLVDGAGGVLISLESEGEVTTPLPTYGDQWKDDPLPLEDARAGAVGLLDLDGDNRLDVYIARTQDGAASTFLNDGCNVKPDGDIACGTGDEYLGFPDVALLNRGARMFVIDETRSGLPLQGQCVGAYDLDHDGRQELITCNDAAYNHVFSASGGGWSDQTAAYGLELWNHGMGIAAGDLDGDARTDLVFSDIGVPLVLLDREGSYEVAGPERGFAPVLQYAWGVAAEDFDNDGDLDILFENKVLDREEFLRFICIENCDSLGTSTPEVLLYRNDGQGHFGGEQPVNNAPLDGPGIGGDGMVVADIDGDGLLDAVIIHRISQNERELWLLRARSSEDYGWIEVAAPFGARVRVCPDGADCQTREVTLANSVRSVVLDRLHFGLGDADFADVSVEWPHGVTRQLGRLNSGTRVRFDPEEGGN